MANVASPKATGGGGTAFEFKVQAAFLATMLVNGRHPCLPDGIAGTIRFQTRHLGYQTDDVFLDLNSSSGIRHRLLVQAKSNMAFTKNDTDFCSSLTGAWDDFSNPALFTPENDALLLMTGPGSKKEVEHFRPLLCWSRTSVSTDDYFKKIAAAKFASNDTRKYLATVRAILANHLGTSVADDRLWMFLKHLHWQSSDLDTPDNHDMGCILTMIRLGMKSDTRETPAGIWGQLLQIAVDYDPSGGALTRASLQVKLSGCVTDARVSESPGIERLREHTKGILAVVQTSFRDGTHLDRQWLLRALRGVLMQNRQLIVAGVAGAGKSATIKDMVSVFAQDMPTFVLKADELDRPHIHQVLTEIGVTESLQELSSRFGLLDSKLLVVESLEKLLEADCVDAFQQLLQFVRSDPTWLIVLSCRSHALGLVQNEILIDHGMFPPVIQIPLLADFELQRVSDKHPGFERLLANSSLKEILRVPMYCSYACRIDWKGLASGDGSLGVQEFRRLLWEQVICRVSHQHEGIHLKRERCFTQVAIARAKHMTPFVSADDYDADALHNLEADELIVRSDDGVAPAHDLFEEWAIDRHIESLYQRHQTDRTLLFTEIGSEPAIRRGVRAWLVDKLASHDQIDVATFITLASQDQSLPFFWRDEVTVGMLLSSQAESYFSAQETQLLASEMQQLHRIIHLLRTACKEPDTEKLATMPLTVKGRDFYATMFLKPVGSGWVAALRFIEAHLAKVELKYLHLILGLLQDWIAGLGPADLSPEGRTVGIIALHLLNLTKNYPDHDTRAEILRITSRVSRAIKEELHALFGEALRVPDDEEEEDYGLSVFGTGKAKTDEYRFYQCVIDSAVETFHCKPLCESMPGDIVALIKKKWMPQADLRSYYGRNSLDIEQYFGLKSDYGFKLHPASALQGPFLWLLKSHPTEGLNLIFQIINSTTERYAKSGLDTAPDKTILQVVVRLNDDSEVLQYVSSRLWGAYRGLSVVPEVLQSALMALEKWMLDLAEKGSDITEYFDHILANSCSCATTAVLTSIAARHSQCLGEHLLPLFRTKAFFELDMVRMMCETRLVVDYAALMGSSKSPDEKLHVDEREEAKKSAHRKCYLEWLALNLQTGPLRERIQFIIDEHLKCLPDAESQTDEDRTWRLALQRMDLRKYRVEKTDQPGMVALAPTPPDKDIQDMQARTMPENEHRLKLASVSLWAQNTFHQEKHAESPFTRWSDAIEWAQETVVWLTKNGDKEEAHVWDAGPVYIAALSIRDHIEELRPEDVAWCYSILTRKILHGLTLDPQSVALRDGASDGTAAAAAILPVLLTRVDACLIDELKYAIAGSLTYPDQQVRAAAIQGARRYLWPHQTTLARSCLAGMLAYGRLEKEEHKAIRDVFRDIGDSSIEKKKEEVRQKYRCLKDELYNKMARGELASSIDPSVVNLDEWSVFFLGSVVQMLPSDRELYDWEPLYLAILSAVLCAVKEDASRTRDWGTSLFDLKRIVADSGSYYAVNNDMNTAVRVCSPIVACIDDCPEFVADFVDNLITNSEHAATDDHFWQVWHLFADVVLNLDRLRTKRLWLHDEKLIRTLLLGTIPWKADVREWKTLSQNPGHLESACKTACGVAAGFEATLSLLYSVGSFYLPEAFTWLADALPSLDVTKLLAEKSTRFMLESLLQREIHLRSNDIRRNPRWQRSVLLLLDIMVDFGSSAAFQLRERMIRPPRKAG